IAKANMRLRQALKINPRFYPALKNLAINEFTLNRLAESKANFERVLKNTPDDDVAHLYLGEIAFAKKECAGALTHYEKTRARVAQNPPATLHYAECLAQSARTKDAAEAL